MKKGDLVRHQHGTLPGTGIVLEVRPIAGFARVMWTAYGTTRLQEVSTLYLEVISEGR